MIVLYKIYNTIIWYDIYYIKFKSTDKQVELESFKDYYIQILIK